MSEQAIVDNTLGASGEDYLVAADGGDKLIGGSCDDLLVSGEGDDFLNGGSGIDTAIYGDFRDYLVLNENTGRYQLNLANIRKNQVTLASADGSESDTLQSIEQLLFENNQSDLYDAFTYVLGENNAVLVGKDIGIVIEDASVTVNVLSNDFDLDGDQIKLVSASADKAGDLSINPLTGEITFNAAGFYDHLAEGEIDTVVVTYTVEDEHGLQSSSTLTITVNGANDAPVAVMASDIQITEGDAPIAGILSATDVDNNAQLTYQLIGNAPAGFTLNADGSYTFDPSAAEYASLNTGQTETVSVQWEVIDEHGASSGPQSFDINIVGVTSDTETLSNTGYVVVYTGTPFHIENEWWGSYYVISDSELRYQIYDQDFDPIGEEQVLTLPEGFRIAASEISVAGGNGTFAISYCQIEVENFRVVNTETKIQLISNDGTPIGGAIDLPEISSTYVFVDLNEEGNFEVHFTQKYYSDSDTFLGHRMVTMTMDNIGNPIGDVTPMSGIEVDAMLSEHVQRSSFLDFESGTLKGLYNLWPIYNSEAGVYDIKAWFYNFENSTFSEFSLGLSLDTEVWPDIKMLSDGNLLISWTSHNDQSFGRLDAVIFNSKGEQVSDVFAVVEQNADSLRLADEYDVLIYEEGGFAFIYQTNSNGDFSEGDYGADAYMQVYDSSYVKSDLINIQDQYFFGWEEAGSALYGDAILTDEIILTSNSESYLAQDGKVETFIFEEGDMGIDKFYNFNAVEGDTLDLADLLSSDLADGEDLTNLLVMSSDGTDTTFEFDGGFDGIIDQTIILKDVDLTEGNTNVLSDLLGSTVMVENVV